MYRNPWISNYLTHVKFCSQGLGSETPVKLNDPRLLQKRALSFSKEFSYDETDDPARSTKDVDVGLLVNLPRVSELRKRFEGITTSVSDCEMNRKERIARRLEGIEGEVHPSLLPSLVANRLLEEDTPRYTRASDTCEPCAVTVQRFGPEGTESTAMPLKSPERPSRAGNRPEPHLSIPVEPVHTSPSIAGFSDLESKAERIARYKAERRRQLAESYGISLDQEPDVDYSSRYTRTRKDSDGSDRRNKVDLDVGVRPGRTAPLHSSIEQSGDAVRPRSDLLSERERLMNLENRRRAAPPDPPSSSSYMDVTSPTSSAVAAKDGAVPGMPPSSPKLGRHQPLGSPKPGVSSGDLLIEQQVHSVLNRQGSCLSSEFASAEADEEKLDERARLSVAAKRSLFRELEKNFDGGAPKPRSRNAAVDRRLRRTQDRSRTQPVTTEEVVIAATLQASSQQSTAAVRQQPQDVQEAPESIRAPEMEVKPASVNQEEPDLCTLSLAEKMALFNRLAQPPSRVTRTRADTRQRRNNARYQTQPITLGDMEQLQNGAASQVEQLRGEGDGGGTVSSNHAGDIHLPRASGPTWRSLDPSALRGGTRAGDAGAKGKPVCPEVEPVTAPERRRQEVEQEEEQQNGAEQSSRMVQDQRGHHREDGLKTSSCTGGLQDVACVSSRTACRTQQTDVLQLESADELSEAMAARHMSIKERVALLKKSGEEDWRNRINKKQDVSMGSGGEEQHASPWEAEQSFRKKVTA